MYKISIPTTFYFGIGSINEIHGIKMPGKKALVVITNGLSVKRLGYLKTVQDQLLKQGIDSAVYAGVPSNPTRDCIIEGAQMARKENCDFVIGLGGGSAMDSAKTIALMATNTGDLWDYAKKGSGKGLPPENEPLPIVCISTTAGTGSEADSSGVITYTERSEKVGVGHPSLFPKISIVDPLLTLSVPPFQTAIQGLDTFFHCVEGYLSKNTNPFKEMYALTAIEKIGRFLPTCVHKGDDLAAREAMSFANTLGGFVMATGGLISEHAMEHILSAYHPNLPHGAGLVLISRAYFAKLIGKKVLPEKFVKLAQTLGMQNASCPEDFLVVFEKLHKDCEVVQLRMSDYGITKEELPSLASEVRTKMHSNFVNDPVQLNEGDCLEIYLNSWK